MEPAEQPRVNPAPEATPPKGTPSETAIEFLPDADEIERRPLPPAARMTLYVLATMVLVFLIWAWIAEVDQIVVARGRLATPLPNIVVQPLETSIIQTIDVRVGQVVRKGERIATLDPTFTSADLAQLRTRYQSLDTQAKRLDQELVGGKTPKSASPAKDNDSQLQGRLAAEKQANYKAQLAKVNETIERLKASQLTNKRDQEVIEDRVKSLGEIEKMQQRLVDQKFAAPMRFHEAREKRLEVERDLQQARNKEAEISRELAAAEAERNAFVNSWRQKTMEELLTTQRDRDAATEQLQKAEKRSRLVVLTAPADSVVLEIAKRSIGSVVREAEPLFTLVPLDAELAAEVQIDSGDIGYVKLGDQARIKFDAYPFQRHGTLAGSVLMLSEDAFRREIPGAAGAAAAAAGADAYYLGRVGMAVGGRLKGMDAKGRLLPGMTVTAEIVVGKRTVLSYLLWPLTKALDEAIREP